MNFFTAETQKTPSFLFRVKSNNTSELVGIANEIHRADVLFSNIQHGHRFKLAGVANEDAKLPVHRRHLEA